MGKIVDGLKRLITARGGDPTGIHTIGEATAVIAEIDEDLNDEGSGEGGE